MSCSAEKIIRLGLVALWCLILASVSANPLTFREIDGGSAVEVLDCDEDYFYEPGVVTDIVIPSEFEGKPVTRIGHLAFENCREMTSVTIPSSVTSIGDLAFSHCTKATFNFPNTITSVGGAVFEYCEELTHFTMPPGSTEIGDSMFQGCTKLTSVSIPPSVTALRSDAFRRCTALTEIDLPDGLETIEGWVFEKCAALQAIDLPAAVTEIGYRAFSECTSLSTIELPAGVNLDSRWLFYGRSSSRPRSAEIRQSRPSRSRTAFRGHATGTSKSRRVPVAGRSDRYPARPSW